MEIAAINLSRIIYELSPSLLIIFGIILIILTIVFFRRFGERVQRIKIEKIGLNVEVSTNVFLTLLALVVLGIGVFLLTQNYEVLIQNYEDRVKSLQDERSKLKQQRFHFNEFARNIREAMHKYHYTFYPDFPSDIQNPKKLSYFVTLRRKGKEQSFEAPLVPISAPFGIKFVLDDLNEGDEFFVTVINPETKEKWISRDITIPEHIIQLRKLPR